MAPSIFYKWMHRCMPLHTHVPAYTCVFGHVCTHMKTHTHKSVRGADVLTVPSSLPPLLAPHSGASVIPLRFCVMQWRHRCHSEIFPRQNHWASICHCFCTSPPQQPSALASLWIANHANQAGMFTPCCLSKGLVSSCVQAAQESPPLSYLSSLREQGWTFLASLTSAPCPPRRHNFYQLLIKHSNSWALIFWFTDFQKAFN